MENKNSEVNAGVHANIGMDFQKNCTIYLFLENYNQLKNEKYFIILEHHEDIIFGFLDNSRLSKIETFQAKKSSSKWTNSKIFEVIKKIAETSQAILEDTYPKTDSFSQENHFVTNNTIELKCKINSKDYICKIDESATDYRYEDLEDDLKSKIEKGGNKIKFTEENIDNFKTLNFKFIDIGRTPAAQFDQLVGKFVNVFGQEIEDHKAALKTLFFALKDIEGKLNQRNKADLKDETKRIDSEYLSELVKTFKKKKLAYDFWRSKGEDICQALSIPIFDINVFKLHFENSFDKFKDIEESEHRKIFFFVNENLEVFKSHFSDEDCIIKFIDLFNFQKSTTFSEIQLKAAIAAAHVEIKSTL